MEENKMIEIDVNALRETVDKAKIGVSQYVGKLTTARGTSSHLVQRGLEDCVKLQETVRDITGEIDKAQQGLQGLSTISTQRGTRGYRIDTGLKDTPLALEIVYQGRVRDRFSFLNKIPFIRKKVGVDQALQLIEAGLRRIPAYIEGGLLGVENVYASMDRYKTDLRQQIENVSGERKKMTPLREDLSTKLACVEETYGKLDQQRKDAAQADTKVGDDVLIEIARVEGLRGEYRDTLQRIELEQEEGANLVGLINTQIDKLDEYQKLAMGALKTIRQGKGYVDTHVPYAIQEIRAQRAIGLGLLGVQRVIGFLSTQAQTAREYNGVLHHAVGEVSQTVASFQEVVRSPYILPEGRPVALLSESQVRENHLIDTLISKKEYREIKH